MEVEILSVVRARTKLRGSSSLDRLQSAVQRWEKVAEDCANSGDRSSYRKSFGESHHEVAHLMSKALRALDVVEDPSEVVNGLLDSLVSVRGAMFSELVAAPEPTGRTDALAYMIAEIELILEE